MFDVGFERSKLFDLFYMEGEHQCLVQLTTTPVTVTHGSASTLEKSHSVAALNALNYCKVMSRKA